MFGFDLSWWVIPLFLAVLLIYLCLCCKRGKRSPEMEERWEASHPSAGDHPYGSNTLFAASPTHPPPSDHDWGQKEENREQCYRIQLPPPYAAPPSYPSYPPTSIPHQSFSATPSNPPPMLCTISSPYSSLPTAGGHPLPSPATHYHYPTTGSAHPLPSPADPQSFSPTPPYPPPPYSAVDQQKY